jgi:lipoprotein NlpI
MNRYINRYINRYLRIHLLAFPTLGIALALPAHAQVQEQIDQCVNKAYVYSADVMIAACTSVIQSGKLSGQQLASAFNNRGIAYNRKGDYEHAIADYNEAISLDPNHVSAYNNRGAAYVHRGDYDRAIVDYSEAIRLDPKYALVLNNRGFAYRRMGDDDHAIADLSEAIKLDPKLVPAYNARGAAYIRKGDYDRAIADFSEAIQLDPKASGDFFNRGIANLYAGSPANALTDLTRSDALDPKSAFTALWLDIARKRNNLPSQLAEAAKQIDMTKWPAPVIRLYLGQLTPEAVLAAADDADAKTKSAQVCEANFFSGELALQHNDKDQATRMFRLASADCPKTFIQSDGAVVELKALGATP